MWMYYSECKSTETSEVVYSIYLHANITNIHISSNIPPNITTTQKTQQKTRGNVRSHGLAHASWDNVPIRSAMEYDAPLPPLTHRAQQMRAQDDVGEGESFSRTCRRGFTPPPGQLLPPREELQAGRCSHGSPNCQPNQPHEAGSEDTDSWVVKKKKRLRVAGKHRYLWPCQAPSIRTFALI